MKKLFTLAMITLMAALPMMAQRHNYNSTPSNRYDYERSHSRWIRNYYGKDMYFGYDWWFHLLSDPWFYVGMVAAAAGLGALVAYGLENKKTQQDPQ